MTLRKLGPKTQSTCIRAVKNFTRYFGQSPDAAGAEDLRRYQLLPGPAEHLQRYAERNADRPALLVRGHAGSTGSNEAYKPRPRATQIAGDPEHRGDHQVASGSR
jgi:hypothetical protein